MLELTKCRKSSMRRLMTRHKVLHGFIWVSLNKPCVRSHWLEVRTLRTHWTVELRSQPGWGAIMGAAAAGSLAGSSAKGCCWSLADGGGGWKKLLWSAGGGFSFWKASGWFSVCKALANAASFRPVSKSGWFPVKPACKPASSPGSSFWYAAIGGGIAADMGAIGVCMKGAWGACGYGCGWGWYASGCWLNKEGACPGYPGAAGGAAGGAVEKISINHLSQLLILDRGFWL